MKNTFQKQEETTAIESSCNHQDLIIFCEIFYYAAIKNFYMQTLIALKK